MTVTAHDPSAEARALVGDSYDPRVLEPSPPAVNEPPFFADDPVGAGSASGAEPLVPAGMPGGTGWNAWLAQHPQHTDWARDRWLAGERRLPSVPRDLTSTRLALHRLAVYVIAPVRHRANGKFGLRWTRGGYGTPFFGDDRQVRVEGATLVDQRGSDVKSAPITTLRAAVDFLDTDIDADTAAEHDSPEVGDVDADLAVDVGAARFLGAWFGMAFAALEALRADAGSVDPSRPQLWPGHFDPAIEVGDDVHRASYGASPGDAGIDEPYLYVSIWSPDGLGIDGTDPAWNASGFTGSVLRASDFPGDVDAVTVAADFWRAARDRLVR